MTHDVVTHDADEKSSMRKAVHPEALFHSTCAAAKRLTKIESASKQQTLTCVRYGCCSHRPSHSQSAASPAIAACCSCYCCICCCLTWMVARSTIAVSSSCGCFRLAAADILLPPPQPL